MKKESEDRGNLIEKKIPLSKARPERAEQPGPPVSHRTRGSVLGFEYDFMK